jgi:hypothetical protein
MHPGARAPPRRGTLTIAMDQVLFVAWLALFISLVVAFAVVFRRATRVVAVARADDGFRRDGAALVDRATAMLGDAAEQIDRVRRRQDAPAALDHVLPGVLEALGRYGEEAAALEPPPPLEPLRGRIVEELERATRAVEVVRHGCDVMGVAAGRPRELEGETSIKRGYLNLLHAREALVTLAVDLRVGRLGATRWFSERQGSG